MGHWKEIGEWHKDRLHGTAKIEFHKGLRYWGQYKSGYGTYKYEDGRNNYHQIKDGILCGYGIETNDKGELYRGEFNNTKTGFGHIKYSNNDEYDGHWQFNLKNGEGVFKEASTGKIERRRYAFDEVK